MDQSILNKFRLTVQEKALGIYGIKIEKSDGDSVTHFWRSNDKVNLYSASKTFASLAVGMCVDDGKLKLTDKALDFFPEYDSVAAPGSENITLRDLLHMASGKLKFWFGNLDEEMDQKDWAELFFCVPVTKKPGTFFRYSNACTYMLGRVVEKVSGQNVRDFLMPRLFSPLDIFNPQWHTDPDGHTLCATQLFLTLDEFSRLGTLLLHGGQWKGRQLISDGYLRDLYSDVIDNHTTDEAVDPAEEDRERCSGYGYQVWRCSLPGTYRADGKYGQFCIPLPEQGAVVTMTAHEETRALDLVHAVFNDIVPDLS